MAAQKKEFMVVVNDRPGMLTKRQEVREWVSGFFLRASGCLLCLFDILFHWGYERETDDLWNGKLVVRSRVCLVCFHESSHHGVSRTLR